MITPSPTTKLAPGTARGTLKEVLPARPGSDSMVVFEVPNTSYQLYLIPTTPVRTEPGKRLIGTITARARRIDVVQTGGRYIEPVFGRPRRIQGSVVAVAGDAVVVDCGVPVHCTPTDARQAASQFEVGQFVSFDVLEGATFTPAN